MRGKPARPNNINAAKISPYSLEETSHHCADFALARHCELPIEEVHAEMEELCRESYPEETCLFLVRRCYDGARASARAISG